jgi:tRNA (guanine37-N1)-methyltransferase
LIKQLLFCQLNSTLAVEVFWRHADPMFQATVLTLYPELFPGPLGASVLGRGLGERRWALDTVNIREFADNNYGSVDDTPAGGGAGLVMRADTLAAAIDSVPRNDRPILCLSPRGTRFTQARAQALAEGPGVIALCGRFEGVDERIFAARQVEEVSIGDFVLAGGEIAAMALIEACVRLIPAVLGSASSLGEESFEGGLLEYPQYTRPREFEGREIPDVLLSGDHAKIAEWRRKQAEETTRTRRPDLWEAYQTSGPIRRGKKNKDKTS